MPRFRLLQHTIIPLLILTVYSNTHAKPLEEDSFIKIAAAMNPAVVTLFIRQDVRFGVQSENLFKSSFGSGFIIDQEGYILTNRHVVGSAKTANVKFFDGREAEAEIVNVHPIIDIAVLKLKTPIPDQKFARLGDSDLLKIGQWVAAIGAPFGLSNTLTKGIVSALGRPPEFLLPPGEAMPPHDFIQTDASINPGNSGGPLVSLSGDVVGVNTMILSPTRASVGIGFAIPINVVKEMLDILKSSAGATSGWIGIKTQVPDEELREMLRIPKDINGLIVTVIEKESPGKDAGLKETDLILSVENEKMSDPLTFERFIQNQEIGKKLKIEIWRRGQTKIFTVKVKEQK
jgi:serine protease Do